MNQHNTTAGDWYYTPQPYNYCPYCGHNLRGHYGQNMQPYITHTGGIQGTAGGGAQLGGQVLDHPLGMADYNGPPDIEKK